MSIMESTTSHSDRHDCPLPTSLLYQLLDTSHSGRGVFATTHIPANTLLLNTSHAPASSPLAHLIQRPYRKEVCAQCFAYDRGREWKVKVPQRECGVVFCSSECLDSWMEWNGELGVTAWEKLEAGVRDFLKRRANASLDGDGTDIEMLDVDGGESANGVSQDEVTQAWDDTQLIGDVVLSARQKTKPGKNERKVLQNVIERGGDPDLMYYLLTATITAYNADTAKAQQETAGVPAPESTSTSANGTPQHDTDTDTSSAPSIQTLLSPLFTLTPTHTSYHATHTSLPLYTTSHLYLHTLLPRSLIHYLTPTLSHNLNTRAAHNAFSIRPPPSSDGSDSGEFLGWGVWPSASFFNHSCAPNVTKVRRGREWEFRTVRMVHKGEELCITYLGGEEAYLGLKERRARLKGEWGFECACEKCRREDAEE